MFGNTCAPFSVECSLCKTDSNESVAQVQGDVGVFHYRILAICLYPSNQRQGLTKQQWSGNKGVWLPNNIPDGTLLNIPLLSCDMLG